MMHRKKNNSSKKKSGTISIHPKGFGFVRMEEGPDVFIPKHATLDAVDGDLVEVLLSSQSRRPEKGPEGTITSILKRGRTHLAASIVEVRDSKEIFGYSPLLGPEKLLKIQPSKKKLKEGDRVICKITSWGKEKENIEGVLDRYLGHISDPSIDILAAIEEYELPRSFPEEVIQEAKAFERTVSPQEIQDRLDLTSWETVTIDPDTAKDFDDAISLTEDEQGNFHLGVHIADVAHYVKPGTSLDREAEKRCNSVYLPGTCIPMLPEALSNELCSLKPSVVRLTQSVLATFDKEGELLSVKIERTAIRSSKRFTYQEAFRVLQKEIESPHAPLLDRMVVLCHLLKRKRMERGSIDFALPDDVIRVDDQGVPLCIERVEYDITHQMIEEFMLKANELVARELGKRGAMLIYRVHEEPSSDTFQDFYTFARALGFSLPATPKHTDIQKLFKQAKDSPLLPHLSVSFIRSLKIAAYSPDNIGHYGLALGHYCHFTSPIRRYTDLIIQRLLFKEMPPESDLEKIAAGCSEKERIAMRAENAVATLKKLRLAGAYFAQDPERVYPAIISRIKPFFVFFEVPIFDLESSFHVSELRSDFYEYNAKQMSFHGTRTGRNFFIGQEIHVRLEKIDYVLQKSEWSYSSPPSTPLPPKKKKRKK